MRDAFVHAMRDAFVRGITGVLLACLAWGCAPLTEQEKYERAERLVLAKEEYLAREEQCETRGGVMQMSARPLEKPGYLDYRSATCVRR